MSARRKVVHVSRPGARIHRRDGMLAVSVETKVIATWRPAEIDRVCVFGNGQVTTQAIALLLAHGAHLSFFSSRGRFRGCVVSPESGNVFLRLAQHARFGNEAFRLRQAQHVIREKIQSGRTLLRRFARNHPGVASTMNESSDAMTGGLRRLKEAESLATVRGIEGAAAAAYFRAFNHMIRPPFKFEYRSKHPGHNPVNALLNLGYTLLGDEIGSRLEDAGFDPRIGYFHGIRYGRRSLALDLLEAHRVNVVDRFTLSLLNRRMFSLTDFEDHGPPKGVRLLYPALRRYLTSYEETLGEAASLEASPRAAIATQVEQLRRAVMEEDVSREEEQN